jgi:cytochrome c5
VSFVGLGYPVRYWFSVFSRSSGLVDSRDAGQDAQEDAPLRRHVRRVLGDSTDPAAHGRRGGCCCCPINSDCPCCEVAGLVGALRSGDADAGGLRALGALADLELHALPLFEAAEARGSSRRRC